MQTAHSWRDDALDANAPWMTPERFAARIAMAYNHSWITRDQAQTAEAELEAHGLVFSSAVAEAIELEAEMVDSFFMEQAA